MLTETITSYTLLLNETITMHRYTGVQFVVRISLRVVIGIAKYYVLSIIVILF